MLFKPFGCDGHILGFWLYDCRSKKLVNQKRRSTIHVTRAGIGQSHQGSDALVLRAEVLEYINRYLRHM